jgi:pimeloyl-ACP methyl ester carboxylesterase
MYSHPESNLRDAEPYKIYEFQGNYSAKIPGYLVASTATLNVEQEGDAAQYFPIFANPDIVNLNRSDSTREMLEEIAEYLLKSQEPEIIVNIHGYNSTISDGQEGCQKIYNYVNENIDRSNKYVFLGYRWASESLFQQDESGTFQDKLRNAFHALPILPAIIFASGSIISIVSSATLLLSPPRESSLLHFLLVSFLMLSGLAFATTFTLIFLRIVVYFRDGYRASNYGVLDLVELFRQLDYILQQKGGQQRVKLSFIGHSMGCFVVTNAIRILSDVFDDRSINKQPDSNIGHMFCLGRLILVAPDIPVETILPGRANFLRSSLRRCEEAYIFCNEGDLALRLTSTAANYFSFPARTRISGYRLGNVAVSHFSDRSDRTGYTPEYGIVNLSPQGDAIERPYKYLEIRSSNREHRKLEEMRTFLETEVQAADFFTYFDCTDYKDEQSQRLGIVSLALQQPAINFWDYVLLSVAFVRKSINYTDPQGVDTHTGYFEGKFSQQAIYELAFLGFLGFLQSLSPEGQGKDRIDALSQECSKRQIQVVLAPQLKF